MNLTNLIDGCSFTFSDQDSGNKYGKIKLLVCKTQLIFRVTLVIHMVTLGSRLQALREAKQMKQKELALGLATQSMISQIETNRIIPSTNLLIRIVQKLDYPIDQFLREVDLDFFSIKELFKFAQDLYEHGEYHAALYLLEKVDERPLNVLDTSEYLYLLGVCQKRAGCHDQAISSLSTALDQMKDPSSTIPYLYEIAESHYLKGDLFSALLTAQRAEKRIPIESDTTPFYKGKVKNLLGIMAFRFGEFEKSITLYQEAYNYYHPKHLSQCATAHMNIGVSYKYLKHFDQAKEHLGIAMQLFKIVPVEKNTLLCKYNYAILLSEMDCYDEAEKLFNECLNDFATYNFGYEPNTIYSELARLEIKRGNTEQAKELAYLALDCSQENDRELGYIYRTLADVYYHKKEIDAAISYLDKSIKSFLTAKLYVRLIESLHFLTHCYKSLGLYEKAIETLEITKRIPYNGNGGDTYNEKIV